MAAATEKGGRRKSLASRTLERCRSGLTSAAGKPSTVAGCFSVYVGPERERFVVRADRANHPLFRRLLDDAEREYGYAAQGPLALPCAVDAFLDVLWHMNHDSDDGDSVVAPTSPICGLQRGGGGGNKGRAAGAPGAQHGQVVAGLLLPLVQGFSDDDDGWQEEVIERAASICAWCVDQQEVIYKVRLVHTDILNRPFAL